MTLERKVLRWLTCCVCTACAAVMAQSPDAVTRNPSAPPVVAADRTAAADAVAQPDRPPLTEDELLARDAAAIDADLTAQQVSNAARIRLEQARDSVVQIRGFYGDARSSAFHGSGFAVSAEGLIVTNYHVVSEAVLYPQQYRLEYIAADGRTGALQVYAIDVKNDLAIVKAADLKLEPLRLRTDIPIQGERAYSIGFPLNLGLTITEGVANGVVANSFDQRIHYTGAINGGMSGGPALDARGAAYGVNVSVVTGRQLVGFVVPARHIRPLLAQVREPLNGSKSPRQARAQVAAQVLAHQAAVFASMTDRPGTQTVFGYTVPTQLSSNTECSTTGNTGANAELSVETINCAIRARLLVRIGLDVGDIYFQHRILHSTTLHPLQFSQRVNREAADYLRSGSAESVAAYACENALVTLDGFDARITTCARQYRLFAELYDIAVAVVSINGTGRAIVSQLTLRGVAFEPGMQFVRRYLGAMRWTR
jgi:serine protease Do